MAPKLIKNPKNGASRISQACDRCRIKKIKCDGSLPSCSNCCKIGFNCKTSDKLTRRSFPKGYTENLEQNLIFLQNENLKLISMIKASNGGRSELLVVSDRQDVDVLLDSLEDVGGQPRGVEGAQFVSCVVGEVVIGKNLVNYNMGRLVGQTGGNGDKLNGPDDRIDRIDRIDRNNSNFPRVNGINVETNSLSFILDSILFKLFLLATGDTLILNNKNHMILNKYIDNFFSHLNKRLLSIVNELEFFTNYNKFKAQLKHLVLLYNSLLKHGTGPPDDQIRMNETSLDFKIQLLLVIYAGNINYSILSPECSQNKQTLYKFFKLNYDYVFLKQLIFSKVCFLQPSVAVLQNMLLFFHLALCYDNFSSQRGLFGEEYDHSNLDYDHNSFAEQYYNHSTENSVCLTKIASLINNYLISILAININSSNVSFCCPIFDPNSCPNIFKTNEVVFGNLSTSQANSSAFGNSSTNNANSSTNTNSSTNNANSPTNNPPTNNTNPSYPSENLKIRLYWSAYILNSFLVLQTGDYTNNQLLRHHYSSNNMPELQSLLPTSSNLEPMCQLVALFKTIHRAVLYDCSEFHLDGKPIANTNKSGPTWENELMLLPPDRLYSLDKQLVAQHSCVQTDSQLLAIQFNLVYNHVRSLIHYKLLAFGSNLGPSLDLSSYKAIAKEFLSNYIHLDAANNSFEQPRAHAPESKRRKLGSAPVAVKSIEHEFIASIVLSHASHASPANASLSELVSNPALLFKALNSILESSAKRRVHKPTSSSYCSSSFKNGFKVVPLNMLRLAFLQMSTLLAAVQTHCDSDALELVCKTLIVLVKNYEFDSTNSGDGAPNWYKKWLKRIQTQLLAATTANPETAIDMSPTNSVNSLFSRDSARYSISTASTAPRRRINSLSVLDTSHNQSLFMKRNSSSVAPLSKDTGLDSMVISDLTPQKKDSFNLNSLFDWNKDLKSSQPCKNTTDFSINSLVDNIICPNMEFSKTDLPVKQESQESNVKKALILDLDKLEFSNSPYNYKSDTFSFSDSFNDDGYISPSCHNDFESNPTEFVRNSNSNSLIDIKSKFTDFNLILK